MGVLNVKIGQTFKMLRARKVRWSQMKQEKVAFFSPPSFRCSTGKWRRIKVDLVSLVKNKRQPSPVHDTNLLFPFPLEWAYVARRPKRESITYIHTNGWTHDPILCRNYKYKRELKGAVSNIYLGCNREKEMIINS